MNIVEEELHNAYERLTLDERFGKMLSMCETVRQIIISQLPKDMSKSELRRRLFEIYYKKDFSKDEFRRICDMIFS